MTPGAVQAAIVTWWDGNGLDSIVTGGLYMVSAVPNATLPYVVLEEPVTQYISTATTGEAETEYSSAEAQFTLFHNVSQEDAVTAMQAIKALLDEVTPASFTMPSGVLLNLNVTSDFPVDSQEAGLYIRALQISMTAYEDLSAA